MWKCLPSPVGEVPPGAGGGSLFPLPLPPWQNKIKRQKENSVVGKKKK